jgi:hypothetical protein
MNIEWTLQRFEFLCEFEIKDGRQGKTSL